jgi:hypothetical protein
MKAFKFLKLSLLIALLFGVGTLFAQAPINPINTLGQPTATDCGIYNVDLRTQQYIEISNISMTLDLIGLVVPGSSPTWDANHKVGTFASGPLKKITLHDEIAGNPWASVFINGTGQLKLAWNANIDFISGEQESFTLPDNTVLWTLEFDVNGLWGTAHNLAWDDVLTIDCELSGPGGVPIYADYWNDLLWVIQNQLALSHTKVHFECPSGQMGSIDLTVLGGIPPYTYQWTGTVVQPPNPDCSYPAFPGATTQDLNNLYPGTYCVTVTDKDFCVVAQYCVEIEQLTIPGPGEVGNPVPIASTVECLADVAPPALPVVEDYCGVVLQPEPGDPVITYTPNPLTCEGTVTYAYTYISCLNQVFVWTYTYTVEHSTPPAEVGGPAEIASTVECEADAVAPTLPVFEDVCGVVLTPTGPAMSGTYVDCEGTIIYTYTYTDCAGLATDWVYTYTVEHSTPPAEVGGPAEIASTVECEADAVAPTLPVFEDVCGVLLTPTGPAMSGTYVDCEGTIIYTYTYTDCAGLATDWIYTYTVEHSTPPAEVGGPAEIASTVECEADAVAPTLPVFEDVCGVVLLPTGPVMSGTYVDCEGTIIYTYTYTDCAGLATDWVYTYTVEHSTPPAEVGGPAEIASTVECEADAVAPTLPVFEDVCGVVLTPTGPVMSGTYVDCEGTIIYTYTYTDCAGLATDWVYTYTIERVTPPAEVGNPVPTASTVECNIDAVPPTLLPVVEDVCGNVLPAPTPVMSSPVNCEGTITYTYTYYDCADLAFVWVYTYTIEHSTPPGEVGGPVEIASIVECEVDALAPGTVYQAGFAGDFDPVNWTFYNTNGGDGSVDVTNAPTSITLTGGNNFVQSFAVYETIIPIDGTVAFNWNYTTVDDPGWDAFGYALDGIVTFLAVGPAGGSVSINVTQGTAFAFVVFTVDGAFGPGVSITDAFLFSSPAFPVVADVCGEILSPVGPVISGTYDGCEGTKIYTYTYTDCAGLDFVWAYTYTIERVTPPAEVGGPVSIASTVECFTDIVDPTLPVFEDICGNVLTPTGPVMSGTYVDCEGTVIYTYTYTDCAGLFTEWVYTYTVDDTQNPTIACPADITVYMNDGCTWILDPVVLGTPVVDDNCGVTDVYNDAPAIFPEGLTVVTWTVEDCAGNFATCTQNVTVLYNTLSGTMVYHNIGTFIPLDPVTLQPKYRPMDNVEITLYEDVALTIVKDVVTTDANGNYSFPGLCANTYYVDITNNNKLPGGVNATDAGQILLYIQFGNHSTFGGFGIEPVRWLAGDVRTPYGAILTNDVGKTVEHFVYGAVLAPFNHYWNYYWKTTDVSELLLDNLSGPTLPMSTTISPANNATPITIFAQCTGDFNGNFAHDIGKSSENLFMDYRENMLVDAGSEFELPIYSAIDMEVGSVSLILNFPSNEAEITGVFLTSDPSSPLQYNVEGNELRIGWYSLAPVWLNKGESLITLQLKLKGETSAEGIQFSLAADPLNELADGNFNVIGNALLVIDIPSTSAMGTSHNIAAENIEFSNHPNPFRGTTTLSYNLPVDGKVVIEVYDLLGTLVKTMVNENQTAGQYSLQLNANSLQPGIYTAVLKLNSTDHEVMIRAIKMINK